MPSVLAGCKHMFGTLQLANPEADMSEPSGMRGDRARDESGRLRQKRGDTHMGSIESEYDLDLGVRSDMHLETYREQTGLHSIEDIIDRARKSKG
jgi:hypothetical protein